MRLEKKFNCFIYSNHYLNLQYIVSKFIEKHYFLNSAFPYIYAIAEASKVPLDYILLPEFTKHLSGLFIQKALWLFSRKIVLSKMETRNAALLLNRARRPNYPEVFMVFFKPGVTLRRYGSHRKISMEGTPI